MAEGPPSGPAEWLQLLSENIRTCCQGPVGLGELTHGELVRPACATGTRAGGACSGEEGRAGGEAHVLARARMHAACLHCCKSADFPASIHDTASCPSSAHRCCRAHRGGLLLQQALPRGSQGAHRPRATAGGFTTRTGMRPASFSSPMTSPKAPFSSVACTRPWSRTFEPTVNAAMAYA